MKIVNVRKFFRSICIILLAIFILSLVCSKSTLSHKEVEYETLYVNSGDTLWDIARVLQANNDYYKGKDIRYIISNLKNINNLEKSNLYVNQKLLIPII